MGICIGDKVMLIHGKEKGVVKSIEPRGVCIVEIDGFERPYRLEDLLKQDDELYNDLSETKTSIKDTRRVVENTDRKYKEIPEIDLHFNQLVPDPQNYRRDEILDYQLNAFGRWFAWIRHSGQKQGMVITGRGAGILRDAVIKRLENAPLNIEWHQVNEGQLRFTIC